MALATDVFQRFTLLTVDKWYTKLDTGTLHDLYLHTMGTELCIVRTGICCLAKYKHALLQ